jgi:DNA-directed RNA polymerase specialized sigma24 family protein
VSPSANGPQTADGGYSPEPQGISAFVARVLNQLALAAWLPGALLATGVLLVSQFRAQDSLSLSTAVDAYAEKGWEVVILALPILVLATLLTQAFSFEAIRTLEGYWHRRGPASWLRSILTRRHVRRKRSLEDRRTAAAKRAFEKAKPRLAGEKWNVVYALEVDATGDDAVELSAEDQARVDQLGWRSRCDAWDLARVDRLNSALGDYPVTSRILPTMLGNVLRATEDRLTTTGGDLEGFALRRRLRSPPRVVQLHDQFRTRLDMYCMLVFVSGFLAVLSLLVLRPLAIPSQLAVAAGFGLLGWSSYGAAIASARGYCSALRLMDRQEEF